MKFCLFARGGLKVTWKLSFANLTDRAMLHVTVRSHPWHLNFRLFKWKVWIGSFFYSHSQEPPSGRTRLGNMKTSHNMKSLQILCQEFWFRCLRDEMLNREWLIHSFWVAQSTATLVGAEEFSHFRQWRERIKNRFFPCFLHNSRHQWDGISSLEANQTDGNELLAVRAINFEEIESFSGQTSECLLI